MATKSDKEAAKAQIILHGIDYLHHRDELEKARDNLRNSLRFGVKVGLTQKEMTDLINGESGPQLSRQRIAQIMNYEERKNGKATRK